METIGGMLAGFLGQLFDSGRVVLATARPLAVAETEAIDLLKAEEAQRRADFPGEAPAMDLDSGYWAARMLYRACQFFASRDLPAESVRADLSEPCPGDPSLPAVIYSADLTFRYLPDIHRLSSGVASADPLVAELTRLAESWPLSGVGVAGSKINELLLEPVLAHAGLFRIYVDRALAAGHSQALSNSHVLAAARRALGAHAETGFSSVRLPLDTHLEQPPLSTC